MNVPPVIEPEALPRFAALSLRELRRNPGFAPGGAEFGSVVGALLPIVYGTALRLVPEVPPSADLITKAVFECLAARWKRLPKRTLLGPWLLQATHSVAVRERKRLRMSKPARASQAGEYLLLFRRLLQLKAKRRNALVLLQVFQLSPAAAAAALRTREAGVARNSRKGTLWLKRKMRKTSVGADVTGTLQSLRKEPPEELSREVLERAPGDWDRKAPRTELTRRTLVAWRWLAVRRFFKHVLASLGATVCVLLALAGAAIYLAQHGYLTEFFIRLGNRELAKQFPGVLEPARQWPVSAEDFARVQTNAPGTSAELYRDTNIWLAKLILSEEQWEVLQPTRIPPVRNMFHDNRIILRNPKAKRSGLSGVLGYDFNWAQGELEFAGQRFEKVAIRYRGNGTFMQSRYGSKQSFKVDLNKYEKKQKVGGVDELNFVNSVPDYSYIRDAMSQKVFRELGVPGPRTAYAYLSKEVAGKWTNQALGLYCLIENIDKDFAKDRFGSKKVPIFKPVTYELFKEIGTEWNDYAEIYDLKTDATPEQLQRVIEFARFVSRASDEEFAERLAEYLEVEEFAAFVAGHVLLSSYDGFLANGQNYYVYLDPRSNRFGFIAWDQDHSWGEFGYIGTAEEREQASIWKPWVYEFTFLKRVMKVPAFRESYRRNLERGLETFFTKERLFPEIDRLAAAIRPAVAAESDFRLMRFDQSMSTEPLPRGNGPAEGPAAPVHQIKRFIEKRRESLRDQLDGNSDGVRLRWRR